MIPPIPHSKLSHRVDSILDRERQVNTSLAVDEM